LHGKGSRISNDARDFGLMIIWSVSNVPPAPATEEAIVDRVVFFTRRGKAARISKEKHVSIKSGKGQERSL